MRRRVLLAVGVVGLGGLVALVVAVNTGPEYRGRGGAGLALVGFAVAWLVAAAFGVGAVNARRLVGLRSPSRWRAAERLGPFHVRSGWLALDGDRLCWAPDDPAGPSWSTDVRQVTVGRVGIGTVAVELDDGRTWTANVHHPSWPWVWWGRRRSGQRARQLVDALGAAGARRPRSIGASR